MNHELDNEWKSRTVTLLGEEAMARLRDARVLVVGVGGVGGYAVEMLARSGVGNLTLVDADQVAPSNLNRQIVALRSDIGQPKVNLHAARIADINTGCAVTPLREFVTPESVESLLVPGYDYVIDAIDTVAPKCALLLECLHRHIPVISSMGAGGRTDPTQVRYADLWETREDGLARAVRQRFKAAGCRRPLRVVCSTEAPHRAAVIQLDERNKRSSFGTLATIPSLFGIYLASHVIRYITHNT